jgi:gliding motility-associated-like protein
LELSGATGGTFNETVTISSDDDSDPLFVFPITGIITGTACANPSTVNAGADNSTCLSTPFILSGTIGGGATTATWSSSGTGTFNDNTILNATYTASLADETSGSVILTLTVAANGSCPQVQDQLILTFPSAIIAGTPSIQSNVGQTTNVDVIASSGTTSANVSTVTIIQDPTQGAATVNPDKSINYVPNDGTIGADSFDYEICNQCGLCSNATVTIDILNESPVITPPSTRITSIAGQSVTIPFNSFISDPNNNIDLNSIQIIAGPLSNAPASFDASLNLMIDYSNTPFGGTDRITIQVCDQLGACSQIVLEIDVNGEIIAYNGISPNGDEKNDYFKLENIEFLEPNNNVTIYNRWGDKVFEMTNYNSASAEQRFEGRQNNGKELPSGVYFYKVEFATGRPGLNGYLTLKR